MNAFDTNKTSNANDASNANDQTRTSHIVRIVTTITALLHAHWLRIILCTAFAAECWYAAFEFPQRHMVAYNNSWGMIYVTAIIVLLFESIFPRTAGTAMSILVLLGGIIGGQHTAAMGSLFATSSLMVWPVAWTVGLLAYEAPIWLSSICCALTSASMIIPWLHFIPISGVMPPDSEYIMLFVAAFAVGYAIRMGTEARQQAQLAADNEHFRADSERLSHLRHNAALQRMIHDSVAGELSYLVLATRPNRKENVPMALLHDKAQRALIHTREAIALLDNSDDDNHDSYINESANDNIATFKEITSSSTSNRQTDGLSLYDIKQYITSKDHELQILGLHGETSISSDKTDVPNPECMHMLHDLLQEIYANIAIHGKTDNGWYTVAIRQSTDEIQIRAENETDNADASINSTSLFHSGKGLHQQQQILQLYDGTLDAFEKDGIFKLFAEIPLQKTQATSENTSAIEA